MFKLCALIWLNRCKFRWGILEKVIYIKIRWFSLAEMEIY